MWRHLWMIRKRIDCLQFFFFNGLRIHFSVESVAAYNECKLMPILSTHNKWAKKTIEVSEISQPYLDRISESQELDPEFFLSTSPSHTLSHTHTHAHTLSAVFLSFFLSLSLFHTHTHSFFLPSCCISTFPFFYFVPVRNIFLPSWFFVVNDKSKTHLLRHHPTSLDR